MASHPSYHDTSSLSNSAASSHHPHHPAGLSSFAPSFHSEDYDQPPAGINHTDWVRIARQQQQQQQREGEGESEERGGMFDESNGRGHDQSGARSRKTSTQSVTGRRPASSLSTRTTTTTTRNALPPPSYGGDSTADSSSLQPSYNHETSASTEDADRTETTQQLSVQLNGMGGEGESTVDETASSIYGGGGGEGRASKQRSSGEKMGGGAGQNMTLREQEKVIDELKKDNFSLKLKLHFYTQRLDSLSPSSLNDAAKENVELKVAFETVRGEVKRYKKLLREAERALDGLRAGVEFGGGVRGAQGGGGGGGGGGKAERKLREEKDEWEKKARELARENKALRDRAAVRNEGEAEELEDLRYQLRQLTDEFDAMREERDDLRRELVDEADRSGVTIGGTSVREKLRGLEEENAHLLSTVRAQTTLAQSAKEERRILVDEVEGLKADLDAVENELRLAQQREGQARGWGEEGDEEGRAELEEALNHHRDLSTSLSLQLEDLKLQLDSKESEVEELIGDLEEARAAEEELRAALEEREAEADELRRRVEERERELEGEQGEVEALGEDLQKLGAQIFSLESDLDAKDAEIDALRRDLEVVDRELEEKEKMHEGVVVGLKEKLQANKKSLSDLQHTHSTLTTSNTFLTSQYEDLALSHAQLEQEKVRLQEEAEEIMRALRREEEERDEDARNWEKEVREKEEQGRRREEELEQDLATSQHDLSTLRSTLTAREADLSSLQAALRDLEQGNGEATSAAELERDGVRRELERVREELEDVRARLESSERERREREVRLVTVQFENKDLAAQLAQQTQTRLALADKHEAVSRTLHSTSLELTSARDRLRQVEDQLSSGTRALTRAETDVREQLAERNGLLLTVYQYMERVGGGRKSLSSSSPAMDHKPFTTDSKQFTLFHDRLLDRLKGVAQLQMSFERRAKELEGRFGEQFAELKKRTDVRLKQLDRCEASVKTATETQRQWRVRMQQRALECETLKTKCADLEVQLVAAKRHSVALSSSPDLSRSPRPDRSSSAAAHAAQISTLESQLSLAKQQLSTAQRRLQAEQARAAAAEEKLMEQREKVGDAEGKWVDRMREMEQRVREAREAEKRERQGGRERARELEESIRNLEAQLASAKRRDQQLDDVLRQQQRSSSSASQRAAV
ncbi:hypothetical protein JCM11251_005940 [Rhodosporidiobolus azoricus]